MVLYRIDIPLWATAYVKADSPEEAIAKLKTINGEEAGDHVDVRPFADLPDISLSPAMTIDLDTTEMMLSRVETID